MRLVALGVSCLGLLTGCQLVFHGAGSTDGGSDSGSITDGGVDGAAGCSCGSNGGAAILQCPDVAPVACPSTCVAEGNAARCAEFTPSNGAAWSDLPTTGDDLAVLQLTEIDTTLQRVSVGQNNIRIGSWKMLGNIAELSLDSLVVATGATLRIKGKSPLILLLRKTAKIDGTIDASGFCAAPRAPGPGGGKGGTVLVGATGCSAGMNAPASASNAGGNGGGFGDSGGVGGNNSGPTAACAMPLSQLLQGGSGGGASFTSVGGDAGGGLQISALQRIEVAGNVLAQGCGGAGGKLGGAANGGGGGGGTGGGILLEAPNVAFTGQPALFANGGGGAQGAGNSVDGTDGPAGPPSTLPTLVAGGGTTGTVSKPAGGPGTLVIDGVGGGGGGASVGKIELHTLAPNANGAIFSPAPQLTPLVFQ